jgi:hypothetical protein
MEVVTARDRRLRIYKKGGCTLVPGYKGRRIIGRASNKSLKQGINEKPQPGSGGTGAEASSVGTAAQQSTHAASRPG